MKRIFFFSFLLLMATSLTVFAVELADVNGSKPDIPSFVGYAPNRIVVKFDSTMLRGLDKAAMARGQTGIVALDHVGARHGVMSLRPQFPGAKRKSYKGKVVDLAGWHKVNFSRGVDVLAVVEEYRAIPGVVDAQPVSIHTVSQTPWTPNDLWYDPPSNPYQWHLPKIMAPEAWGENQNGNPGVIVAVLDTGVKYFDPDLGGPGASYANPGAANGNMWINWTEKNGNPGVDDDGNGYVDDWIGYDFVQSTDIEGYPVCMPPLLFLSGEDCDTADNDPRDFHGHGTHVSGIVGALTNNEYGVAAPAGGWVVDLTRPESGWDKGVRIMPLRIGWSALLSIWEVGVVAMDFAAEAIHYAERNGAKIINCSWGSENTGGLGEAIDSFLASGGLIFKAAGNNGEALNPEDRELPDYMCGDRDDVICVAATDQNDCKASFSSYGTWVHISAPGVGILSLFNDHTSPPEKNWVALMSGTSMAAPLAASVAALIWSKTPGLLAGQVRQTLFDTADPIDGIDTPCNYPAYEGKLGAGRINAYAAVTSMVPPPTCTDSDEDRFAAEGGDCGPMDCDDSQASINPGALEVCGDGIDQDCSGSDSSCPSIDNDNDGYTVEQGDCDDSNPDVNPLAIEICDDSIDNDCDNATDSADDDCPPCTDVDGDKFAIEGGDCGPMDCDDGDPHIFPGAYDYCNNDIDEDCDGFDRTTGKGCKSAGGGGGGGGNGGGPEICDDGFDNDGDGKADCSDKKDCGRDPACQ